jgi:hypothetical protein
VAPERSRQIGGNYRCLSNAVLSYHHGMNPDEKREYNRLYQIANKARIEAKRAERKANAARRCSVPGCDRVYDTRGYCARHYMAWRRNGDATEVRQQQIHGKTLEERVAAYINRAEGCWEWTSARNPQGYGVLRVGEGNKLAHRLTYEQAYGPIPLGMYVLHRCDNPGCVRPDHLFLGTLADNNADMRAKGRARGPSLKGSAIHNAKLTEAIVRAIRKSPAKGVELARKYGVSQTIISAARKGHIWKHVK